MATTRINVLVYSGNGSSAESVRHCLYSLQRLLTPQYAVTLVGGDTIIKEPWTASCALLVFPGGADLGYCRTLNGAGNRRIAQYVQRGGAYLGFCAGGYYGSTRCEFEVGDRQLEVVGERELAFFPGICRGCAYKGFVYHSERGARAAKVRVERNNTDTPSHSFVFRSYYNGGGLFVDADTFPSDQVTVLASYVEPTDVDGGGGQAAVVHCRVGQGSAILTGSHPEFAAVNLNKGADVPNYPQLVDDLAKDEALRTDFLKICLTRLGLVLNEKDTPIPSLSRLHLSALTPSNIASLLSSLRDLIVIEGDRKCIQGENDTFQLIDTSALSLTAITDDAQDLGANTLVPTPQMDGSLDSSTVRKEVEVHEHAYPASQETPHFNHQVYYTCLQHYRATASGPSTFGTFLMYGEVVTSTNTMLERNIQLLQRLPTGFTTAASMQLAGRGRGSNVWVSPAGSLVFSTCIRHDMDVSRRAPVVFIQYLAALAIVEGIKTYDVGYETVPVMLKWPNDIYAADPTAPGEKKYVKIGGILVNSSFSGKEYLLVVGIGLNVNNAAPTTSLNALLPPRLAPMQVERVLARILTSFETLYVRFQHAGFSADLESRYYRHWLHTDQIITLGDDAAATVVGRGDRSGAGGSGSGGGDDGSVFRARIKGITRDWGLLLMEQLGWEDRATGRFWQLQSDGNSFDFFRGLIRRKV